MYVGENWYSGGPDMADTYGGGAANAWVDLQWAFAGGCSERQVYAKLNNDVQAQGGAPIVSTCTGTMTGHFTQVCVYMSVCAKEVPGRGGDCLWLSWQPSAFYCQ